MGLKVYFDSCIAIYLIEEHPIFSSILENHIANCLYLIFITSNLVEMECIILPLRNQNQLLLKKFEDWFQQFEIFELNRLIFQQAAQLRADFPSLKTPDALHISTAIYPNCHEFWTNDNRLDKIAPNLVKKVI